MLAKAEAVVAAFADFNRDRKILTYTSAVVEMSTRLEISFNFDRIYFGDGKGGFSFNPKCPYLQSVENTKHYLPSWTFDQDGDLDIFVGASIVSGDYGASLKAHLLKSIRENGPNSGWTLDPPIRANIIDFGIGQIRPLDKT